MTITFFYHACFMLLTVDNMIEGKIALLLIL